MEPTDDLLNTSQRIEGPNNQYFFSQVFLFPKNVFFPKEKTKKLLQMSQVHLLSSDNEEFKVDKEVAERSVLIKNMLEGKVFFFWSFLGERFR